MFKKMIALILIVMSLFALFIPASLAENAPCDRYSVPFTMYVMTASGGTLNVRNIPGTKGRSIIGTLDYGTAVTVLGVSKDDPDWVQIKYSKAKGGTAWVWGEYLSMDGPTAAEIAQAVIRHEMRSYKDVTQFTIAARPTHPDTGWVNFRSAPSSSSGRITTLKNGQILTVIGETTDWYKAIDSVTGRTGYVSKAYVAKTK